MKETGASGGALDAEVQPGPASDQTEVQRLEALLDEATYAVERLKTKVGKAEQQLKDAKAAYATAQDEAKAAARELAAARKVGD
jgi:chromosome segregation ATPase